MRSVRLCVLMHAFSFCAASTHFAAVDGLPTGASPDVDSTSPAQHPSLCHKETTLHKSSEREPQLDGAADEKRGTEETEGVGKCGKRGGATYAARCLPAADAERPTLVGEKDRQISAAGRSTGRS